MTRQELFQKMPVVRNDLRKILILTHTDLDGAGAYAVIRSIFPKARADVLFCGNNRMSNDIISVLRRKQRYDMIFATDISISEKDSRLADSLIHDNFLLFDHHASAEYLNKYKWACVYPGRIEDSPRNGLFKSNCDWHTSGTALVYEYLSYVLPEHAVEHPS